MPDVEARRQRDTHRRGIARTAMIGGIVASVMGILTIYAFTQQIRADKMTKLAQEREKTTIDKASGGRVAANVPVSGTRFGDTEDFHVTTGEDPTIDEDGPFIVEMMTTQAPARSISRPRWAPPNVKFSGKVEVSITIAENGSHSEEIVKGTGIGELDHYLKDFFSRWRWEPGKFDGKPVKTTRIIRVRIN